MLSVTSNYALRAVIYLAQHVDEWPISGKTIAREAGIPASYLSRILGDMVRGGLLLSRRGPNGGFQLSRPSRKISLHAVLERFESVLADHQPCPFQNQTCSDEDPCLGHHGWKKVREVFTRHLRRTTVYDVSFERHARRSVRVTPVARRKRGHKDG